MGEAGLQLRCTGGSGRRTAAGRGLMREDHRPGPRPLTRAAQGLGPRPGRAETCALAPVVTTWATSPTHTRTCRQSHPGRGRDEWPHSNEMETSRRVAGRRSVADGPSPRGGNKKDRPAAGGRQGRNYTFTLPFSYCDGAHTSPPGPGRDTPANFQRELWDRGALSPGFLPAQPGPARPEAGEAAPRGPEPLGCSLWPRPRPASSPTRGGAPVGPRVWGPAKCRPLLLQMTARTSPTS